MIQFVDRPIIAYSQAISPAPTASQCTMLQLTSVVGQQKQLATDLAGDFPIQLPQSIARISAVFQRIRFVATHQDLVHASPDHEEYRAGSSQPAPSQDAPRLPA